MQMNGDAPADGRTCVIFLRKVGQQDLPDMHLLSGVRLQFAVILLAFFNETGVKSGQQIIVSYRAISRLAKMTQILSLEEALKTCLVKGTEKDDLNIIYNGLSRSSKYKSALWNVINSMVA